MLCLVFFEIGLLSFHSITSFDSLSHSIYFHCDFFFFVFCHPQIFDIENASRFCHANGTWDKYTDYDQCKHVEKDLRNEIDMLPQLELAAHIYSIGYTLSLIALSLGLAVFIHFK